MVLTKERAVSIVLRLNAMDVGLTFEVHPLAPKGQYQVVYRKDNKAYGVWVDKDGLTTWDYQDMKETP